MELFARLLCVIFVTIRISTGHEGGEREPEHSGSAEGSNKDGEVKGSTRAIHRIPLISVPSTATVVLSACDSNPCAGGKVCSDIDDGYKCTCPQGSVCDAGLTPNILLDGKPAKPSPPTDADIIINSFKPPVPQAINSNEQPTPIELEPDAPPGSLINDTVVYDPVYANNEYGGYRAITPNEADNGGNGQVISNNNRAGGPTFHIIRLANLSNSGGYNGGGSPVSIMNAGNENVEPDEQNNDDYEDYSPNVGEPETLTEPESVNEIPLPTPPTDDDLDHTPPTLKRKKPAVILLKVVRVPRFPTTPMSPLQLQHCLPNPCRNNGTCIVGEPGVPYACKCPGGYSGKHCKVVVITRKIVHIKALTALPTPPIQEGNHAPSLLQPPKLIAVPLPPVADACNSNPCKQGGTCIIDIFRNPKDGSFRCFCRPGFTGQTCGCVAGQEATCTDRPANVTLPAITNTCRSNPCQQGGTCIVDVFRNPQDGTFKCICRPGFTGKSCGCVAGQEATCTDAQNRALTLPQLQGLLPLTSTNSSSTPVTTAAGGKAEDSEDEVDHMLPTPPADHPAVVVNTTYPTLKPPTAKPPTKKPALPPATPPPVVPPVPTANRPNAQTGVLSRPPPPSEVVPDEVDHKLPNVPEAEEEDVESGPEEGQEDEVETHPEVDEEEPVHQENDEENDGEEEVDHMLPTSEPTPKKPGLPTFPTPAKPEAPEGTDIEKLPSITSHECKNGGRKPGDKTNGCEPIFVYMIKKKAPIGPDGTITSTDGAVAGLTACTPNPCQNGGTCHSFNNGEHEYYSCICLVGFDGKHCEIKTPMSTNVTMFQVQQPKHHEESEEVPEEPPFDAFNPTPAIFSTPPKPPLLVMMSKTVKNPPKEEEDSKDQNVVMESFESDSPCTPNPCQNGGTCHAFENSQHHYYSCVCPAGFEGDHCQGRVNVKFISMRPHPIEEKPVQLGPTPAPPQPETPATIPVVNPPATPVTIPIVNQPATPATIPVVNPPATPATIPAGNKPPAVNWPTGAPNPNNAPNVGVGTGGEARPCLTEGDDAEDEECKPSYVVMMTPRPTLNLGQHHYKDEEMDEKEPNPCYPNPCQNGGTCHAFFNGDYHYYSCICPTGFEGTHCQEDVCAECHIFAICPKGKCKCKFGYIGDGYDCINATTGVGEARDFTEFTLPTQSTPTTPSPTTVSTTTSSKSSTCYADVAFLIDVSPSMWSNIKYIRQLLKSVSQEYSLCKNGSHAAIVTFASTANMTVKLSQRLNQSQFEIALDETIDQMNGSARLDLALATARDVVFNPENGGRKNVKKIVIAITSGEKTRRGGADNMVVGKIMRHEGIAIHLIVVGQLKSKKMVEVSGKQNLYVAETLSELSSKEFVDSIRIDKCLDTNEPAPPKCSNKVDIGFILDSSGSVWKKYDQEKEFLKSIAMAFGLGRNGSHAGVVTFSSGAEHSIKLKDHPDLIEFCEAVDAIRHMGGSTRIDLALLKLKKNMFTKENGGRKGVKKIVVLVTDGVQTGKVSKDPSDTIAELQDDGITVIVVGVGHMDTSKLTTLAGPENFYHASNFSELNSNEFVRNITADTCEKLNIPLPAPQCDLLLDIGFVLDSSGSIRRKYGEEKRFIKTLASLLGVSQKGSHAGVVTFSSRAKHTLKLDEFTDLTEFNIALDNIPLMGQGTRIDRALKETKDKMFTAKNGARPDAQKLVIMVTDGEQRGGKDPALVAQELRDDGIALFVIGVGHVNSAQLEDIAGKGNWYLAKNFSELNSADFLGNFTDQTCHKVASAARPKASKCSKSLDIGFVIDSSASIKSKYKKEKAFVKSLAQTFGVGNKNGNRAGVVTFSTHAKYSVKLNGYKGLKDFGAAVDSIGHMNGYTKIDRALKLVKKKMFLRKNGGRKTTQKLVVLITDGEQTGRGDPARAAKRLRDAGINLLVIGIGDLKPLKLNKIAGKGKWHLASDFKVLNSKEFIDNITTSACKQVDEASKMVKKPKHKTKPVSKPKPLTSASNSSHSKDESGSKTKGVGKPKLTIYNINMGPTYVFNGLELHQSPVGNTLYGKCPQFGGRIVYEVEQITPDELISLVEPLSSHPGSSTGGAATTQQICDNLKDQKENENNNCDLPPVPQVPTYVTSAPVYQAGKEELNVTTPPPIPLTPPALPTPQPTQTVNLTPPLLLRRLDAIDEQFGKQTPPSFPSNQGMAAPAIQGGTPAPSVGGIDDTQLPVVVAPAIAPALGPVLVKGLGPNGVPVVIPVVPATGAGGVAHKRSTPRKRNKKHVSSRKRSVQEEEDADFFNFEEWKALNTLTEDIGCTMFLNDLVKYGVIQNSAQFRKAGEHVTIFCPVDAVYKKVKSQNKGKVRSILMNHVAARQDRCGSIYKSLYPGGRIIVNPSAKKRDKVVWKANGADILISLADEEGNEIVIMNEVIMPVTKDIEDILESRKDTSSFYDLWRKSDAQEIFKTPQIKKVCFINDVCLKLTPLLQKALHDAVQMKEYTIVAPTNSVIKSMGKPLLQAVQRTRKSVTKFLQDFVFLGSLESPNILHKETAYSLSPQHDMLTLGLKGSTITLTDDNNQEFKVKDSIRVKEGILHIVE